MWRTKKKKKCQQKISKNGRFVGWEWHSAKMSVTVCSCKKRSQLHFKNKTTPTLEMCDFWLFMAIFCAHYIGYECQTSENYNFLLRNSMLYLTLWHSRCVFFSLIIKRFCMFFPHPYFFLSSFVIFEVKIAHIFLVSKDQQGICNFAHIKKISGKCSFILHITHFSNTYTSPNIVWECFFMTHSKFVCVMNLVDFILGHEDAINQNPQRICMRLNFNGIQTYNQTQIFAQYISSKPVDFGACNFWSEH